MSYFLRFFARKRVLNSEFYFSMRRMESSRVRKTTGNQTRTDGNLRKIDAGEPKFDSCSLERCREVSRPSLYSVIGTVGFSFLMFLRWFLVTVFLGPAQHVKRTFDRNPSSNNFAFNNGSKPKSARVFILDDVASCDKLMQSYRSQYPFDLNFLGMDCEWVDKKGQTNFPVALLQIATPLSDCFLVRLCKMDGQLPETVREILEDKNALKFGVGIMDDAKRLSGMFGINVDGCVDLRHVIQRCRMNSTVQSRNQKMSLDALAKRVLGVTMDKYWRIRCSNWEAEEFERRQIEYAMNDAMVASHMFLRLAKSKVEERKMVKASVMSEDSVNVTKRTSLSGSLASQCKVEEVVAESMDDLPASDISTDSQKLNSMLLEDEPNPAYPGEMVDWIESGIGEIKEEYTVESNQESHKNVSMVGKQESSSGTQSSDLGISDQVIQAPENCSNGFAFDTEVDVYNITADLNKWESGHDTDKGYLLKEEVIHLLNDSYFCQRARSLCHGVVDLAFKNVRRDISKDERKKKEDVREMSDRKPYKTGTIRKSPLYMNCMLAAPDGLRLCTLDRKKADWYIEKGIGELTCLDPYTVQLNFEPSGRPGSEDSYYLYFKDNICVVCGSSESYMRKNVVPHDYRRYFPLVMKEHHSHDVLLMCPECHRLSTLYDDKLRKELADKYSAPLGSATVARLIEDLNLKKVKSAAKALHYAGRNLPAARQRELTRIVQEHLSVSSLTPEMIQEAATMETRKENLNFISHGQEVVKKIREEGKLLEFEKMWRQHFLDTMRPRHLPPLWSVGHRHDSLMEKLEELNDS